MGTLETAEICKHQTLGPKKVMLIKKMSVGYKIPPDIYIFKLYLFMYGTKFIHGESV